MNKLKITGIWVAAFLITLAAAVFQRMTGPTHPFQEKITLQGHEYKVKLPRSFETGSESVITLPVGNQDITGVVSYRIYPSNQPFLTEPLLQTPQGIECSLPQQPAAGKIEYRITLTTAGETYETPFLVARYKDPVPAGWLIPHIICMFIAMLFSVSAGIMAVSNFGNYSRILLGAGIFFFLGGIVFGPIVQKYAFGAFWTGIPLGWDLTDNKTLIALLFFVYAIIRNRKKPSRLWTLIAVLVLLIIYSIPHSLLGSQLDPETGKIIQASISHITLYRI